MLCRTQQSYFHGMAMELRHLRYFIAVATEGHITRAAEQLNIQQPPLSRQIKALEQELDVQLFRRKARGVELTEAGKALLEGARAILARLDNTLDTTRRAARGEQGRISVGVTPTCMYHPFVPKVVRAFREAFPYVMLELKESPSSVLFEHLTEDQVDACFVRITPSDPTGIAIDPLLEEPMVVALPRAHTLARGRPSTPLSLQALAGETFIVYGDPHGPGIHAVAFRAFQAAGFSPLIGQQAPQLASTLNLVAVGLGASFVPASLQRMHVDGVAYRRLVGALKLAAPIKLATRRGDPSVVVRNFRNLVRGAAKKLSRLLHP
jgi:DNA-binding transcriptional LysR family regulator